MIDLFDTAEELQDLCELKESPRIVERLRRLQSELG
jgi:hypothetical protein